MILNCSNVWNVYAWEIAHFYQLLFPLIVWMHMSLQKIITLNFKLFCLFQFICIFFFIHTHTYIYIRINFNLNNENSINCKKKMLNTGEYYRERAQTNFNESQATQSKQWRIYGVVIVVTFFLFSLVLSFLFRADLIF